MLKKKDKWGYQREDSILTILVSIILLRYVRYFSNWNKFICEIKYPKYNGPSNFIFPNEEIFNDILNKLRHKPNEKGHKKTNNEDNYFFMLFFLIIVIIVYIRNNYLLNYLLNIIVIIYFWKNECRFKWRVCKKIGN